MVISLLSRPTCRTIPLVAPRANRLARDAGMIDRAGTLSSSNASCAQRACVGNGSEGGEGGGTSRIGEVLVAAFKPRRCKRWVLEISLLSQTRAYC